MLIRPSKFHLKRIERKTLLLRQYLMDILLEFFIFLRLIEEVFLSTYKSLVK